MVNGCTDNTLQVAKSLAAADRRITVRELPLGDKANAWNEYVHFIAPDADAHIFMDGDIRPSDGAIAVLADALESAPRAFAAAALPAAGRSRRRWAFMLLANHYLSGNLYALSNRGLSEFRARKLRMPLGAKGEDGIISYLLLTDFDGGHDDTHTDRIIVAADATFEFDSLGFNKRDIKTYRHRLARYSERHFQKKILYRLLKERGADAMPENIYDIYTPKRLEQLSPRFDPVNFWFDLATLKRLRSGGDNLRSLAF